MNIHHEHNSTSEVLNVTEMDIFLSTPTSCRIWDMQWVQDGSQNPIVPETMCLIISRTQMNILFITKVKIQSAH